MYSKEDHKLVKLLTNEIDNLKLQISNKDEALKMMLDSLNNNTFKIISLEQKLSNALAKHDNLKAKVDKFIKSLSQDVLDYQKQKNYPSQPNKITIEMESESHTIINVWKPIN